METEAAGNVSGEDRTEATSERRRRKDARFGRGSLVASFGLRPRALQHVCVVVYPRNTS
jgi:hypothetical protein